MGQVYTPGTPPSIILSAVDRLVAVNADGGVSPNATHIILFGENAGHNLGALTNVIALGLNAFDAGIADVNQSGTIVIGGNAYSGLIDTSVSGIAAASVIIGNNAMGAASGGAGANVVIGTDALADGVGGGGSNYSSNVVIGVQAGQHINFLNGRPFDNNVIVGLRAARGISLGGGQSVLGCVIIGEGACENFPGNLNNNVVIGLGAGAVLNGDLNTIIGVNAVSNAAIGGSNVAIGNGAAFTDGSFNVVVGAGSSCSTGGNNTFLGARQARISTGSDNVIIGNQAGVFSALANASNQFLVESAGQSVLYGSFTSGSVAVGVSATGTNRDLPGTNILKLIDGTSTGVPVGGGFAFSSAGELRWKATGGAEKILTGDFTVGTLPAAAGRKGSSAFVTDALAPAFNVAVAAGGAVYTRVHSDNAAWIVG